MSQHEDEQPAPWEEEANTGLKITSVQYSHLFNLGNYENEKFGASAAVPEDEDPQLVLEELMAWVHRQGVDRENLHDMREEEHRLAGIKLHLEKEIASMRDRFERAKAFLEKHGVDTSQYAADPDYPF